MATPAAVVVLTMGTIETVEHVAPEPHMTVFRVTMSVQSPFPKVA